MRVEQLDLRDKEERRAYRDFVQSHPLAMSYHSAKWLDFIEYVVPHAEPLHLCARDGSGMRAVLPAFRASPPDSPAILNSLPFFGSHGGILSQEEVENPAVKALAGHLDQLGKGGKFSASTLITPLLGSDNTELLERWTPDFVDERIAQVLEIPDNEEDLMSGYSRERRNNVRQARRKGVELSRGMTEDRFTWLKEQHEARMDAIGGATKPDTFFSWVRKNSDSNFVEASWATLNDTLIGGMILFEWGPYVEYYLPVFDIEYSEYNPLPFLIHEAILESDATYWNFGGTREDQEGVHRFKRQFGAEEVGYSYLTKVYDQGLLDFAPEEVLETYPCWFAYPFDQV